MEWFKPVSLVIFILASISSTPAHAQTEAAVGTQNLSVDYVTVNTSHGPVRGKVDREPRVPVAKFYGIRYAEPPVGHFRFRPPSPPSPWSRWTEVKDAFTFGPKCLQRLTTFRFNNSRKPWSMSEDCLYLNVYSPQEVKGNQSLLPVMVWIHGGNWATGGGSEYDATYLAAKGVVMVTINYRLDIFGFLSTEDDVMPGNYGMLDQVAALKWVQGSIKAFGGDPAQVTVFGESAGSSSVSLLILSPLARGLFSRGIMESGSSLATWAYHFPGYRVSHKMAATNVSNTVGCGVYNTSDQVLECLQNVDSDILLNVSVANTLDSASGYMMNPRVDSKGGFMPESPMSLLIKGDYNDVDTISGFNTDEFDFYYGWIPNANAAMTPQLAVTWLQDMCSEYTEQHKLVKILEHYYIQPNVSNEVLREEVQDALSDLVITGSTLTSINQVSKHPTNRKHFLYEFNYRHSQSLMPDWLNAVHTDEIDFVFNVSLKPFVENRRGPPNLTDIAVSEQMMTMWTNFAKTGDPLSLSPSVEKFTWRPYTSLEENYLVISEKSQSKIWQRPQIVDFYKEVLHVLSNGETEPVFQNIGNTSVRSRSNPAWVPVLVLVSLFILLLD